MRPSHLAIRPAVFVAIILASGAFAQQTEERRPPRSAWTLSALVARVESIDYATREVTLRGQFGELVSIEADDSIQRLDEIAAGDFVVAEYWTYIKAEFRDPTPEEKDNPLVILAAGEKAIAEAPPGASIGAIARAVVTIEIINRPDMLVTVKGPGGNYVAVSVEDSELIKELRIGELLVLTYAEALAISLEKASVE